MVATRVSEDRFSSLDGMRALAVSLVIVFHFGVGSRWILDHAGRYVFHFNVGVEIFFVLSGFLIYRPFVAANLAKRRPRAIREYASRRLLRIYPAYLLAFFVLWGAGEIHVNGTPGLVKHATLTYSYFHHADGVGIAQSWTIVVELSFYVFAPLWAALMRVLSRRGSAFVTEVCGCAFLVTTGFVTSWFMYFRSLPAPLRVLPPALPTLAGGMLLATFSAASTDSPALERVLHRLGRPAWAWWLAATAVFIVLAWMPYDFLGSTPSELMWDHSLKAPVALLLLVPIVFADRAGGPVRTVLRLRPVVYLGLVSYGVYLWHARILTHIATSDALNRHGPLSAIPAIIGGTAATIAVASVSYYALERPALRLSTRVASRGRRDHAVRALSGISAAGTSTRIGERDDGNRVQDGQDRLERDPEPHRPVAEDGDHDDQRDRGDERQHWDAAPS